MLPWKIISPRHFIWLPHWISWQNTIYINQKNGYERNPAVHDTGAWKFFRTSVSKPLLPQPGCAAHPVTASYQLKAGRHSWNYIPIFTAGLSKDAAKLCAANQAAILKGLYATADMGIHYEGWTLDDTAAFFSTADSLMRKYCGIFFELIVSEPANYLKYYIGYLEFHDLQEKWKSRIRILIRTLPFMKKLKNRPGIIQCAAGLCVGEPVTSACRFSRRS